MTFDLEPAGLNEADHAVRATRLGTSERAEALGVSSFQNSSPWRVYARKKGLLGPEEPTLSMLRGAALEPVVAEAYRRQVSDIHPNLVMTKVARSVPDPVHDELSASFDYIATGTSDGSVILVECKSRLYRGLAKYGEEGTDEIPDESLMQIVAQYMTLKRLAEAGQLPPEVPSLPTVLHHIALTPFDDKVRIFPVEITEDLLAIGEEWDAMAAEWCRRYVRGNEVPELDGSDQAWVYVEKSAPTSVDNAREPTADEQADFDLLLQLKASMTERNRVTKEMEKEIGALEQKLLVSMGSASGLVFPDGHRFLPTTREGSISWKSAYQALGQVAIQQGLDTKRLEQIVEETRGEPQHRYPKIEKPKAPKKSKKSADTE